MPVTESLPIPPPYKGSNAVADILQMVTDNVTTSGTASRPTNSLTNHALSIQLSSGNGPM